MKKITVLIKSLETFLARLPLYGHGILAVLAFALTRVTNIILDTSYAASQYPVPFYVGQTAFSGEKIKAYFAYMLEQDTLGIYWRTQFIDFSFIAATFISGLIISFFLARLHPKTSWLYKLSLMAAVIIPLGAVFDALENLVSFVMLSQPTSFPNWLALVYSSFAVLKFASITIGYSLWLISLFGFLLTKVYKLLRRNSVISS